MKIPARLPFAVVTKSHIDALCAMLTGQRSAAVTDSAALEPLNRDWMGHVAGAATLALFPSSTVEVQSILKYCSENNIAVVPQGGNTGLVYGSTPVHDEIILSTAKMNDTLEIHRDTFSATVGAGVILQNLHDAAKDHNLFPSLEMGSKGSCMIGGNVATNAGGIHYARYGSMRSNVLGLEVVTANGTVLPMMSALRKDNTGYSLRDLFVGSEGTLGVITKAELVLRPYPKSSLLVMMQVNSFEKVLQLYKNAFEALGEVLSAFEVMDTQGLQAYTKLHPSKMPFPLRKSGEGQQWFCVLIEARGSNSDHDMEKLVQFSGMTESICADQVLALSESHSEQLWEIREGLPVALASSGRLFKFDLSFPIDQFYRVVEHTRQRFRELKMPEEVIVTGYGHFGDGNVHLNVLDPTKTHQAQIEQALYPEVYRFTQQQGGSVSAEHGIGLQKKEYFYMQKPPACVEAMKGVKSLFDPKGILNPYKLF